MRIRTLKIKRLIVIFFLSSCLFINIFQTTFPTFNPKRRLWSTERPRRDRPRWPFTYILPGAPAWSVCETFRGYRQIAVSAGAPSTLSPSPSPHVLPAAMVKKKKTKNGDSGLFKIPRSFNNKNFIGIILCVTVGRFDVRKTVEKRKGSLKNWYQTGKQT